MELSKQDIVAFLEENIKIRKVHDEPMELPYYNLKVSVNEN